MTDHETLLREAGWRWGEGYAPESRGTCTSCRRPVLWAITRRGARAPLDRDGRSHFATCPDAARHRGTGRPVDEWRDCLWTLVRSRDVPDRVRSWARSALGLDRPRPDDVTIEG